ncbi:MAG: ComF family protein [Tenacibaculum sp.]|nr:ComF family protein [Tenacibaculum sp.]
MTFLKNIIDLFYPNLCLNCDNSLLKSELVLCSFCRHNLPIIDIKNFENNEITNIFYGRFPIKKATSFLYFTQKNISQKLIHQLKYKGRQDIGTFIGNWFGSELNNNNFFENIDCIIPIPLHPNKMKKRGYNQLTTFGKKLSEIANIPYIEDVLLKGSSTKTQTLKQRFERFNNEKTKFYIKNKTLLENKNILLIDDVITTGATLEDCCNELLKIKNININIATITYTKKN